MSTSSSANAGPTERASPTTSASSRCCGLRADALVTPGLLIGFHFNQRVCDPHATAARADEYRVEVDRRELPVGRDHEIGKSHTAVDQRLRIARSGTAKSIQQRCGLQAS